MLFKPMDLYPLLIWRVTHPNTTKPPLPNRHAQQSQQAALNQHVGDPALVNTQGLGNHPHRVRWGAGGLQVHGVAHQLTPRCMAASMKPTLLLRQLSAPPASPRPSGHPIDTEPKPVHPGAAATDRLERQAYSAVVDLGTNGRAEIGRSWCCL